MYEIITYTIIAFYIIVFYLRGLVHVNKEVINDGNDLIQIIFIYGKFRAIRYLNEMKKIKNYTNNIAVVLISKFPLTSVLDSDLKYTTFCSTKRQLVYVFYLSGSFSSTFKLDVLSMQTNKSKLYFNTCTFKSILSGFESTDKSMIRTNDTNVSFKSILDEYDGIKLIDGLAEKWKNKVIVYLFQVDSRKILERCLDEIDAFYLANRSIVVCLAFRCNETTEKTYTVPIKTYTHEDVNYILATTNGIEQSYSYPNITLKYNGSATIVMLTDVFLMNDYTELLDPIFETNNFVNLRNGAICKYDADNSLTIVNDNVTIDRLVVTELLHINSLHMMQYINTMLAIYKIKTNAKMLFVMSTSLESSYVSPVPLPFNMVVLGMSNSTFVAFDLANAFTITKDGDKVVVENDGKLIFDGTDVDKYLYKESTTRSILEDAKSYDIFTYEVNAENVAVGKNSNVLQFINVDAVNVPKYIDTFEYLNVKFMKDNVKSCGFVLICNGSADFSTNLTNVAFDYNNKKIYCIYISGNFAASIIDTYKLKMENNGRIVYDLNTLQPTELVNYEYLTGNAS